MSNPESAAIDSGAMLRLRALFRRLALAAATLTFVVIVASAFMRHTQAGLGCADWPACYGRIAVAAGSASDATKQGVDAGVAATPSDGVRLARLAHRVAATGVLALVIGLLLIAWTQKPVWKREGRLAAAALVIAGLLAALGVATPGAQLPAVTLGNLIGGYLMFALLAATWASNPDAQPTPAGSLVVAALAVLLLQAALGGMIGAQSAVTSCPELGGCAGAPADAAAPGSAFDPFRALATSAGRVIPPADAATLHVVHRVVGLLAAIVTLWVAIAVRRSCARAAAALATGAVLMPFLGALAILAMPALALTVLHNAVTALTIATLAALAARR